MKSQNIDPVTGIVHNVYHYLDPTLYDHGRRVSYILFEMLRDNDQFSESEKRDIYMLCLLHDIGAVKTKTTVLKPVINSHEEISQSIIGYLIFKNFSPLSMYADCILYQYQYNAQYYSVPISEKHRHIARLLYLANCLDSHLFVQNKSLAQFTLLFKNTDFEKFYIEPFLFYNKKHSILMNLRKGYYEGIIQSYVIKNIRLSKSDMYDYFKTFLVSQEMGNDFYAFQAINSILFGQNFGEILDMNSNEIEIIKFSSIMHNLNGISSPPVPTKLFLSYISSELTQTMEESSLLLDCFYHKKKAAFTPKRSSELVALSYFISDYLTEKNNLPKIKHQELFNYIKNAYRTSGLKESIPLLLGSHYHSIRQNLFSYYYDLNEESKKMRDEYHFLHSMLMHYQKKYEGIPKAYL